MYEELKVEIEGIAPLLMHNCQLANPLNQFTRAIKAITAKGKKKTDADLIELARLEFMGGLYVGEKGEPIIPGELVESCIRSGAKRSRKGQDVLAGVISDGNWPLLYEGPKSADALWDAGTFHDTRGAGVQKARVMRTRPIFRRWKLKFTVSFLPEIVNRRELIEWIESAGQYCGLGDFRPRFGRFATKVA